jgi:hypothetical protein
MGTDLTSKLWLAAEKNNGSFTFLTELRYGDRGSPNFINVFIYRQTNDSSRYIKDYDEPSPLIKWTFPQGTFHWTKSS